MQTWEPASEFEARLLAAYLAPDPATCLGMLLTTEFALPITPAAAAGKEPPGWITATRADRTWLIAYTSVESMFAGTAGEAEHWRITTLVELAAGWPNLEWGLAVNPGLPPQLLLESGTVARLAAPTLVEEQLAAPDGLPPLVQKVLIPGDIPGIFARRDGRVSGYVHALGDVIHIGSPNVLLDALGRSADEPEIIDDEGSVFLLRWPAIGAELYRVPYGGPTEPACAAVEGWVIEEPPFVGTGFVPNVDQLIREFKVDGIVLPHRAEIIELSIEGVETRRAVWDGDRGTWMLTVRVRPEADQNPDDPPLQPLSSDRDSRSEDDLW